MAPNSASTSSQAQQTISSFFAKKRKGSFIDLTADDSGGGRSPLKRLKDGETQPSFSIRDSISSDSSSASLSCLEFVSRKDKGKAPEAISNIPVKQSLSKWQFSLPPSDDAIGDSVAESSSNGKGKKNHNPGTRSTSTQRSATKLSFREKLERRDLRKDSDIVVPGVPSSLGQHEQPTDGSGASEIRKMPVESPLPWEKGGRSRKIPKTGPAVGPAGIPCTPLEEAVIQFKRRYADIILLIEVGYKYCFFGDDAKIAGRVLGFSYGMDRNFLRTSCPVHNLKINVKKLVAAGYKVGVVSQIETAALKKAGDNRNTLFERELTKLYTPSTFVDDLDSPDEFGQATPSLMSIVEEARGGLGPDDKVLFGIISVVPSTGGVVYDEFEDTVLRAELDTRLMHMRPCELLLPSKLSMPTEKALLHFADHGHSGRVRVERSKHKFSYSEAFDYISEHHEKQSDHVVAAISDLPKLVVVALALAFQYLTAFGLADLLLHHKFFQKFRTYTHMLLNTNTIRNLEIYQNQTDFSEKGTLFSVLDHTTTMFGKRLLKAWVGRPLVDKRVLQERVDAVEEARLCASPNLTLLRGLLKGLPDLARGLCNIQYGRCSPKELATSLNAFKRVGATFPNFNSPVEVACSATLWTDIVFALPSLKSPMNRILATIDLQQARENKKEQLWTDSEKFPSVESARFAIMAAENELAEQLKKIRKVVKIPSLKFVHVLSDEYLIEIPKERASAVPTKWVRTGSTKNVVRFHTPEVIKLLQEREQHKETLQLEAEKAYKTFLRDIAQQHYSLFRDVVNKLATADCLMSLATISLHGDFCKPNFVDEVSLSIVEGRHPIIEQLRSEPFVPNSVSLGGTNPHHLVISGPNMGGKTSIVKMAALLLLMAQIGSYVPAISMSLSMHDAILTRMGASDDLAAGRSTFMVEIAETCEIIKSATSNSLVILDELGRGTSTFDGMAIAGAVLQYLAREVKCQSLFITHYPSLARELEARYPHDIGNRHMSFIEDTRLDGRREIRFLYLLTDGISKGSFGIECARLAALPESILQEASSKAVTMQELMEKKTKHANVKNVLRLLRHSIMEDKADATILHEIKAHMKIMGL